MLLVYEAFDLKQCDYVFKMYITTKIFLNIDTKELNYFYLFNVKNRGRIGIGMALGL